MTLVLQKLLMLLFMLTCAATYGPNIEHLQEIYEKSSPGEMPCYYDGSLCKRGEEYCSVRSRTCEPLFHNIKTENEKVIFCEDIIINKTITEQGMLDTCIYFFGILEIQKGNRFKCEKCIHMSQLSPGKEYCPAADKYCQLGNEICNSTSGKCESLFPDINDDEKREKCQEVIEKNVTKFYDACIYALGRIQGQSENNADSHESTLTWAVTVTSLLGIFVLAGVSLFVCWRQKYLCFRKPAHVLPIKRQAAQCDIKKNENKKMLGEKGDQEKRGQAAQSGDSMKREERHHFLNENGDLADRD